MHVFVHVKKKVTYLSFKELLNLFYKVLYYFWKDNSPDSKINLEYHTAMYAFYMHYVLDYETLHQTTQGFLFDYINNLCTKLPCMSSSSSSLNNIRYTFNILLSLLKDIIVKNFKQTYMLYKERE